MLFHRNHVAIHQQSEKVTKTKKCLRNFLASLARQMSNEYIGRKYACDILTQLFSSLSTGINDFFRCALFPFSLFCWSYAHRRHLMIMMQNLIYINLIYVPTQYLNLLLHYVKTKACGFQRLSEWRCNATTISKICCTVFPNAIRFWWTNMK